MNSTRKCILLKRLYKNLFYFIEIVPSFFQLHYFFYLVRVFKYNFYGVWNWGNLQFLQDFFRLILLREIFIGLWECSFGGVVILWLLENNFILIRIIRNLWEIIQLRRILDIWRFLYFSLDRLFTNCPSENFSKYPIPKNN